MKIDFKLLQMESARLKTDDEKCPNKAIYSNA